MSTTAHRGKRFRVRVAGLVLAPAWLLVACGSATSSAPPAPGGSTSTYSPRIDPSTFTDTITNRYFPLRTGTYVYDGTKDGAPLHIEMKVLTDRKTIMGVRTVVVHDSVFVSNKLEEDTYDWYAQDAGGSVWYFGEDTKELDPGGKVTSTKGTWLAGVDGAQPGIVMTARPATASAYQQEYARGVAEDRIKVLRTDDAVNAPGGAYRDVVETEDTNPLEPSKLEHKWFAPGVGFVASDMVRGGAEHIQLVRFEQP
jgi:hypothetical protein